MKYKYSKMSREISGFGGDYEQACRDMVRAGMRWWDEHPKAEISFEQSNNIYGLTANESNDCKTLSEVMDASIGCGCSSAMMQACLNHLMYAHEHGWDQYMEKMVEERPKEENVQ